MRAQDDMRVIKQFGFASGYSSDEITHAFAGIVAEDIATQKRSGFPVAKYDMNNGKAYLENSNGSREYVRDE